MAITERTTVDKIEVVGDYSFVQVRTAYIVEKDGVEIGRTFHRHTLVPGDDYSQEDPKVIAICDAIWTPELVQAYKDYIESQEGL